MSYLLNLDWPPSVNHIWRKFNGHIVLDKRARAFRLAVASRVAAARARGELPREMLDEDVAVELVLYPPDRRRRDLDNYCKSVFDALTHAGLWRDDSQIKHINAVFGEPVRHGAVSLGLEVVRKEVANA